MNQQRNKELGRKRKKWETVRQTDRETLRVDTQNTNLFQEKRRSVFSRTEGALTWSRVMI